MGAFKGVFCPFTPSPYFLPFEGFGRVFGARGGVVVGFGFGVCLCLGGFWSLFPGSGFFFPCFIMFCRSSATLGECQTIPGRF